MRSLRISRLITLALVLVLAAALLPARPSAAAGGGTIAYGNTVSGSITSKAYYELWQFEGKKGDRVQIYMEGDGQLDPYLGLVDMATEEVLAEDDDSGGNGNALIETTLNTSGSFVIIATRYDLDTGTTQGTYTLTLTGGSGPTNVANPVTTNQPVEIEPGIYYMGALEMDVAVNGVIDDSAYAQIWSVEATAGTELVMAMLADNSTLDSYLFFADAEFNLLAEDDDTGGEVGAGAMDAFLSVTVPATGEYMVVASRAGVDAGKTSGAYMLVVSVPTPESAPVEQPVDDDLPADVDFIGPLALDVAVQGTLSADSFMHLYSYDGQAGEELTITMIGTGGLDSYLGLLDPAGNVLAEDDDSGGGLNALITYTLPESGTYLVAATRTGIDEGTTVGPYTLTVSSGAAVAAPASGLSAFGGLPGRSIAGEGETFMLRGNGASNNPEKSPPVEAFLGLDTRLPGSRHPLAGLIGHGWQP